MTYTSRYYTAAQLFGRIREVNPNKVDTKLEVEYHTLTPQDISQQHIILNHIPTCTESVDARVVNGPTQMSPDDFMISGSKVSWYTTNLTGIPEVGDVLKIVYTRFEYV